MEDRKRIIDISRDHGIHKDTVLYRARALGIIPTDKFYYDKYQIQLILDFERTPRSRFIILESKINETI